jgi:hypothetical protein
MRSTALLPLALLVVALPGAAAAQHGGAAPDARIRSALSAAPASVADHATVADLDGTVLRPGTNGWVCMPDMPDVPNDSPMCLDASWRELIDAWQGRREPRVSVMGFGYMLQGDLPVSNTDPYAQAATADNQWIQMGRPHVMVVVPDHAALEGLPTDPGNGGPWVMWKGTPYAHIMIPTEPRVR